MMSLTLGLIGVGVVAVGGYIVYRKVKAPVVADVAAVETAVKTVEQAANTVANTVSTSL